MTRFAFVLAVPLAACTLEPEGDYGWVGPPVSQSDDDADGDDVGSGGEVDAGSTTGAGGDGADSVWQPETTGGADPATGGVDSGLGETGMADGGTFGDPSDDGGAESGGAGGAQPDDGMYSHCLSGADCGAGLGCIGNPPTDGICTAECAVAGNPANCDANPGGTAVPMCAGISGLSLCALDCSGGRTCPAGMVCQAGGADGGVVLEMCI